MKTRPSSSRAGGFTLIEVMVALVVMAVLAGLAWRGIDGVARTRDAGESQLNGMLRLTNVVAQWEIDLRALRETDEVPAIAFDGSTLRLTRSSDEGVQLVAWAVRDRRWLRWASPVVTHADELRDWWLRSQQLNGSEREQLPALENVGGWQVYFFRVNAWTNAQSSGDVVSTSASQPATGLATTNTRAVLPTGVRAVLSIGDGSLTRDLLLTPTPEPGGE